MGLVPKPGALHGFPDGAVAIFSLNHRPIGKSTQAQPNTAGAHVGYITRPRAASHVEGRGVPTDPREAREYFNAEEAADRKNARVADKVMLALPKELNPEQRLGLVRGYAEEVTQGRAPWLAAFHDQGKDANNPHCHLVIRDRDPETGRRVIQLSEKGSTQRLRDLWETHANRALAQAGQGERIDRRSLAEQGEARAPTIHEGPRSRAMEARGVPPRSRFRDIRNGQGARRRTRRVDYPTLDKGRSRSAYNRQQRETPAEMWEAIDADRQRREFAQLAPFQGPGLPERDDTEHPAGKSVVAVPGDGGRVVKEGDGPAAAPFGTLGREFSGAPFKPQAEGVARTQAPDEPTDQLRRRVTAPPERLPAGTDDTHDSHIEIIGKENSDHKGNTMSDDDWRARREKEDIERRARIAKANYDNLMEKSYLHPKDAEGKMDQYRADNGNEDLYQKLRINSGEEGRPALDGAKARGVAFGRRPGSVLARDGYEEGAAQRRRDSQIARRALPQAVKDYHETQQQLAAARRAFPDFAQSRDDRGPGGGHPSPTSLEPDRAGMRPAGQETNPDKGMEQGGSPPSQVTPAPSFSQRLAAGRTPAAPAPVRAPQEIGQEPGSGRPGSTSQEPERADMRPARQETNPREDVGRDGTPLFQPSGPPSLRGSDRASRSAAPGPEKGLDWASMSPLERQANQHKLLEQEGSPPGQPPPPRSYSQRLAAERTPAAPSPGRAPQETGQGMAAPPRPASFSQKLAADRAALAADPEKREQDKQRTIERMRKERDPGIER